MDVDVLTLVAAAFADAAHSVCAHQREALRQHPRRSVEVTEALHAIGGESGFFLQLLDRRRFGSRVWIVIADETCGKLDTAAARRHARLIDEDDLVLIF